MTASQTSDAAYQAYRILQAGFIAAPILAGTDKFFNILVNWEQYLVPFVGNLIAPGLFMAVVGVVEIAAGIGVALKPRIFAYVVAAWLAAIIVNLLILPGYFDVALRDLGLASARWHSADSVRSTIAPGEGTDSHSQTVSGNRMILDPTGGIGMVSTERDAPYNRPPLAGVEQSVVRCMVQKLTRGTQ